MTQDCQRKLIKVQHTEGCASTI